MSVNVEFHFDFGSPNSYFSHRVIPAIEQRTGISFTYFPVLLGGIFKATNNRSPMEQFADVKNKKEYNRRETERFLLRHEIDNFQFNANFPVNTLLMMRAAVYASDKDYYASYIDAMYRGMWEKNLDMSDPEIVAGQLQEAGLNAEEILTATQNPQVKQGLIDNTSASVERGNFGSPTFFVDEEMFFGKDRLRDVEEEILSRK